MYKFHNSYLFRLDVIKFASAIIMIPGPSGLSRFVNSVYLNHILSAVNFIGTINKCRNP